MLGHTTVIFPYSLMAKHLILMFAEIFLYPRLTLFFKNCLSTLMTFLKGVTLLIDRLIPIIHYTPTPVE